jgi:hypothetical protein
MKPLKNLRISIRLIRILLIPAGILFLVLGICRQEAETVMMKAIYICLECIGIG